MYWPPAAGVTAAILLFSAPAAGTTPCFTAGEAPAAKLRAVQQEFTIAALTCLGNTDKDLQNRYNIFIGIFADALKQNARELRIHFARVGGQKRFDAWMTLVANEAAERAAIDVASYCRSASEKLGQMLALKPAEVPSFVASLQTSHDVVSICHPK